MRWLRWSALWLLAGLLIIALTQCEMIPTGATDVSCSAFSVMTFSSRDTEETIRIVRQHNAAWRSICDAA